MRTTIRLEEMLLCQLKQLAMDTHRTLTAVIEDAVREVLARKKREGRRSPVKLPTSGHGGLRPGIDLNSNASVLDAMEEPRDLRRR
jgi:hypothetical protein